MNEETIIAQINDRLKELDGENLELILIFVDNFSRKIKEC